MRTYALQPGGFNSQAQFCAHTHGVAAPASSLPSADVVPVGSVEWTREYAARLRINLGDPATYPEPLRDFLLREVRASRYGRAKPHQFVKPMRCKAFTGGIRSTIAEAVAEDERVWISEPVEFTAEWRCYVLRGEVVGVGRYDDGCPDEAEPDMAVVGAMLAAWPGPAGWALDVGLLADGRTALVEVNDAWALGYYHEGCSRQAYLDVIAARWDQIVALGTWGGK